MKTIYVYVDAENVSFDLFEKKYSEIKREDVTVVGKVYGGRNVLGGVVPKYLMLGFDYVETSSLSCNKKNLSDMKMIVDCMEDVIRGQSSVDSVYVLSKDSDFLPLVYKIISYGIPVHTLAISQESGEELNMTSLYTALRESGLFPITADRVLGVLFDLVKESVCEEFSDDLILEYVESRKNKLSKAIRLTNPTLADKVDLIPAKVFSFRELYKLVSIQGESGLRVLFNVYTTKVFGVTLTDHEFSSIFSQKGDGLDGK